MPSILSGSPVKIGFLGAGHIAGVHARHAARVPGVTVAAFADLRQEKAEGLAGLYGAAALDSAERLLESDVDAVVVAIPTYLHRELAEMALQAGKHVLCEKPLALTVADCDALDAASEAAGRILTVGHVVRFFPEYAAARQQVIAGTIGNPAVARTHRAGAFPKVAWFADEARSGGVLFDLLIHDLDWLLWTLGPVERVYARLARVENLEYAAVTLRHVSGAISQADGTWGYPAGFSASFEIAGDSGLLTFDSRETATLTLAPTDSPRTATAPREPDSDPYYRQFAAFAAAVRGESAAIATVAEARDAVRVAAAAQESARTGQAVVLT